MIYFDDTGLPVDKNEDGGDSAHFAGVLVATGVRSVDLRRYDYKGLICRHPSQDTWNNRKNFSRDQLIAYLAGVRATGQKPWLIFARHILRLGFCQNWERDIKGSTKYPWPHKIKVGDAKDIGTWRLFDAADILSPSDWAYMVVCLRLWPLYFIVPMGLLFFILLELPLFYRFNTGDDDTNTLLKCHVFGIAADYKANRKNYKERLYQRWVISRDMVEIYEGLIKLCTS